MYGIDAEVSADKKNWVQIKTIAEKNPVVISQAVQQGGYHAVLVTEYKDNQFNVVSPRAYQKLVTPFFLESIHGANLQVLVVD
jgi:hypothetical protein